jgi:hypothetical protein
VQVLTVSPAVPGFAKSRRATRATSKGRAVTPDPASAPPGSELPPVASHPFLEAPARMPPWRQAIQGPSEARYSPIAATCRRHRPRRPSSTTRSKARSSSAAGLRRSRRTSLPVVPSPQPVALCQGRSVPATTSGPAARAETPKAQVARSTVPIIATRRVDDVIFIVFPPFKPVFWKESLESKVLYSADRSASRRIFVFF